jgi:hypothetical protein
MSSIIDIMTIMCLSYLSSTDTIVTNSPHISAVSILY